MKNLRHVFLCLFIMTLIVAAFTVSASAEVESVTNAAGTIRIDYDTESHAMHIVNVNSDNSVNFEPANDKDAAGNTLQSIIDKYKYEVTSVKIDFFGRLNQTSSEAYFFYGYTALKEVNIAANQRIRMRTTGMFEGCTALTTVWVGDEKAEGVASLVGILNNAGDADTNNIIVSNIFKGCSSLKKVVLPTGSTYNVITNETFEGCTSLEEVTIGENFLIIADDAFADCPRGLVINATEGSSAYKFAEAKGLLPDTEYVSLWSQKPTSTPDDTGYLWDWDDSTGSTVETNIKFDLYTSVEDANVNNTLYIYIDDSVTTGNYADNKTITSPVADSASIKFIVKSSGNSLKGVYPFTDYNKTHESIYKIVIGEGIEGIDREAFALLINATTIELPESFTAINGSAFREMNSLSTVYVRGSAPKAGVIDLSGVTYIDFSSDNTFSGMSSAEKYVFNENVEVKVDESDYLRNAFYNNTSLKTLDLSNMAIGGIGAYTFQNCTALEEIYLPASVAAYKPDSNDNASFKNNTDLKAIYAPVGSTMHTYAMTNDYDTTHTADIIDGNGIVYGKLTFFPESGKVEILKTTSETNRDFYSTHGATVFFSAYKELITEVVIPTAFQKLRTDGLFTGLPNLASVCFAPQRIYDKTGSIFANCPKLTTVYFGDETNIVEGVADFTGMNVNNIVDRFSVFLSGLFTDCTSLKKVILPNFVSVDASNENAKFNPVISATTFSGCTALTSVTIPANMTSIADGAFESCTALTEIVMNAPASIIGESTFAGNTKGLVIYCQSISDANTVNTVLKAASISTSNAFAFYQSGMSIKGYQIRTEDYNGLRTVFSFNETAPEGYTLVEYGSIVATAENWYSYSQSFGNSDSILSLVDGKFVTPDYVVKKPVYENNGYVYDNITGEQFSVTVVKFQNEEQFKAEIVNSGYEIWKDADGNYYVIFTREEAFGYDTISLYKTTLGMLNSGAVKLTKNDTDPVWNTLNNCTKTALVTDNEAVSAMLLDDPLNEGKYIAVYATNSAAEQKISSLGLDASVRANVSANIFGTNITYTLPLIDDYWAEHIDSKLASLPEGKSFIIYTDTHYLLEGGQNTRKLPALISYVREQTGIKTVINMGDPYQKELTMAKAEEVFRDAVEDDFYSVYGEDGLFVVGNHDANITGWNKLVENATEAGTQPPEDYTVLLPDSVIYDATISYIENKEGIVFDTDMLALADGKGDDDLTFNAVGVEGSEPYYSADDMKAEFIAWVKQHYYYDDAENGIRYIVYNSGNCSLVERHILGLSYSKIAPTQIKFIANALATVPQDENGNDYDVVVLGHMLGSNADYADTYAELYKLLSAFKAGREYSFTYSAPNATAKTVSGIDGTFTVDYTDNAYNGTVFTMSGHWHRDLSYVYETAGGNYLSNIPYEDYNYISDDAIFYIGINNDNYSDVPDGTESEERDPVMTMGTATENCFSIITITDSGEIILTRIGAGVDRTFNYNN